MNLPQVSTQATAHALGLTEHLKRILHHPALPQYLCRLVDQFDAPAHTLTPDACLEQLQQLRTDALEICQRMCYLNGAITGALIDQINDHQAGITNDPLAPYHSQETHENVPS